MSQDTWIKIFNWYLKSTSSQWTLIIFSYFKLIKYLDVKEINIFLLCVFENFISCNKGNLFPLCTNLNKKKKIHCEWLIE